MRKNVISKGFTLVELIVVITILAILGTIAILAFSGYSKNARDSARVSDIGNIKKTLELWILQSGSYPEPTDGVEINYSGGLVWTQGTFGETVFNTVGKLDKKPVDPLYDIEYTYSVTQSKKEYQISSVLERDMASNLIIPQTYAATSGKAYVSGTYNGVIATSNNGGSYILALPSIILSDTTTSELKNISGNILVYEGKSNLPASYKQTGLTMTGSDFSFTPVEVWSGGTLNELNNQEEFQNLVTKLQDTYKTNTTFSSLPEYSTIVSGNEITSAAIQFTKSLIETNLKSELTDVGITPVDFESCNVSTKPIDNGHIEYIENPTSANQSYQLNGGECGYTCTDGFSGTNCATEPVICNSGESSVTGVCKDPYWNNVTLLLHFNGSEGGSTFTDSSSKTLSITKIGQVYTTSLQKPFTGSMSVYFDGTTDALGLPNSAHLDLGADFTIETFIKTSKSSKTHIISGNYSTTNMQFAINEAPGYFNMYNNNGMHQSSETRTSMYDNAWHHIAASKNGTTLRYFIDGVQVGTNLTSNSSFLFKSGGIGAFMAYGAPNFGQDYLGYMSEFRITNGTARYTTNFTPPIKPFPNQ